tara:strand:- start:1038 stop:1583 length:546 start_codon:yes stop_codon:yes gene_type:complete
MPKSIIVISFFLLITLVISSCNNNDINNLPSKDQPVEITFQDSILYSDMGNSKIKLISEEVHRYDSNNETILECPKGMMLTFYDSLQQQQSLLKSDYGKFYTEDQYLLVKENVVFSNYKKDTLFTDLLHIYFKKDSLYTDQGVQVSSGNGVVFADELIANSNFTFYQLLNIKDSHIKYEEQ